MDIAGENDEYNLSNYNYISLQPLINLSNYLHRITHINLLAKAYKAMVRVILPLSTELLTSIKVTPRPKSKKFPTWSGI